MQEELLEMKKAVAQLHDTILQLSTGLWGLNTRIDDILLADMGVVSTSEIGSQDNYVEDGGALEPEEEPPQAARARGRPRQEAIPEPPEPPRRAEPRKEAKKPAIEPEVMPPAPEQPKKQGIVDRLLGKDASDQARLRADRMAQLRKELSDLKKK